MLNQNNLQRTPKTPCAEERVFESRLESLPIDLLVVIARQFHFDSARQEMLQITTPLPTDHWPFVSKGGGKGMLIGSPHTPKAPKHCTLPPSRLKCTECAKLQLFSSKNPHFLQNAWCHCWNLSANPWLLIEPYSMRMNCMKPLRKNNLLWCLLWLFLGNIFCSMCITRTLACLLLV